MKKEFELKPFDKVLVRDSYTDVWEIDLFENDKTDVSEYGYKCLCSSWMECVPFEGNEHLLGTTESPQEECPKEETEKKDEVSNNYGYPVEYFKRKDIVLCRDDEEKRWEIDSYLFNVNSSSYPFRCDNSVWRECIPYEGNEHLLGTTDKPERYDSNKNTLFGIKLKPGYVLEFEYGKFGVVFPIREIGFPRRKKLAIIYNSGAWVPFEFIEVTKVIAIKGCAAGCSITSGEVLWKRAQKQSLTKAEIAEKYGMNVKDFEIIDEESDEKE